MTNRRRGNGYHWSEKANALAGSKRESEGFTVDNLNTKDMSQAANLYEKIFVTVREVLEKNHSSCMDVEEERLQCCQDISDEIAKRRLLR